MFGSFRKNHSRRAWLVSCFVGLFVSARAFLARVSGQAPLADIKFTPPPGEETAEVSRIINQAKAALETGRTVTEVLMDGSFMPVHAWPRFRALIREHAPVGEVTLVPASEPGTLLHVSGTVRDANGQPLPGAVLYVYHTSARGWYSDKAAHISGNSGDVKHARLFAYLKADAAGKYSFRTIRPAGYPQTDLPAHIHVHVDAPGNTQRSYGTEVRFDDDPRLTPAWRERSRQEGFLICPVKRENDRLQSVAVDFQFR